MSAEARSESVMLESRSLTDDEALWFPAHVSAGDSFLRVTRPDGAPEPEDDGIGLPNRKPPKGGGGRKPPRRDGIKASSWVWITLWGVAAISIVGVAARKEIAAEMTQNWLKNQGVAAKVKFDKLSLSHVSGMILIGDARNPDVNVEHFDADYTLNLFAGHGQPLARLTSLRAVHPLVAISYKGGKLGFGSLNKLVQDALNAPSTGAPPPRDIILEDATILLQTDYGLVRGRGGVTLKDGQLTGLSLKMPKTELNGPQGAGEIVGGQITARSLNDGHGGDQLEIHGAVTAANWDKRDVHDNPVENIGGVRNDLHLQGVTVAVDTRLPYRKGVTGLAAFTGVMQGTVAIKAEGLQSQMAYVSGLEANLRLDGQLKSDKDASQYEGAARLLSRAQTLNSGGIESRNVRLEGPALGLRARLSLKDGLSAALAGALTGDVGSLRQGGLSIQSARLNMETLSATVDSSGGNADFKGGLTLAKAAAADLALDKATVRFAGNAHSDSAAGQWSLDLNSDINSDYGRYSGLTALADARRPDPKAPAGPKDEIVALDRAFQRFSLRVKGLKVALMGQGAALQYDVRLHGSAVADLNGGGKVTLAPQPVKPLLATGEAGAFALSLTGPDLPQAALTVTKFGADARSGALAGAYTLAAQITTAPVEAAKFEAHGTFASSGGGLNVTLDAPAKVTLTSAELGDHVDDVAVTIAQRDGAFFRMSPSGWRITGVYSDLLLTAPNEGLRLKAAQGPFDVFSQGGSDVLGLKMAMESGTLSDALPTEQVRFNPLLMTGTLSEDTRALTGRFTAATPSVRLKDGKPRPIAGIDLDNDVRTGKGSLSFRTLDLSFSPDALQPSYLSPPVTLIMAKDVTGLASFTGAFNWTPTTSSSSGVLKLYGFDFTGVAGVSQGLSGEITFNSLAPLTSTPGQRLSVKHMQVGVPLEDLALSLQFQGDHAAVESATVMSPGGPATLEPMSLPFDGTSAISGAVVFNGLDFGKIVAATDLSQNMSFTGNLSGRVPFTILGGHITFAQGHMAADGPGRISVKRSGITDMSATGSLSATDGSKAGAAQTAFNPFQDLAFQAMEHVSYDQLDAKLNSLPEGKLGINFHIKGRFDPPQPQKATISIGDYISGKWMTKPIKLPSGTPVELYLDVPVNLDEILNDVASFNAGMAAKPE